MDYDPNEDWSPARWLGAYAYVLWSDYLNYWELQNVPDGSEFTEAQRDLHHRLHEIAEGLLPCLYSLSVDDATVERVRAFLNSPGSETTINRQRAAEVAAALRAHPIIRDGIRIDLALHAVDLLLVGAEERGLELIALVADRALSERAAAFLDRATRLYLWGFGPEAVVMCASVLEAAYESRFPPTEMIRLQIRKKGQEFEPYEYERAALAAGVFSKEHRDMAAKVRRARNDTLHNVPNTTLGAEEAIRATALLLSRLYPRTPEG